MTVVLGLKNAWFQLVLGRTLSSGLVLCKLLTEIYSPSRGALGGVAIEY